MRAPPESVRGEVREPSWTREWHRPNERAAVLDRARGAARKARRHDEGRYSRSASSLTKAHHLVQMEVTWVDCLVWVLRALVAVALFLPSFASAQDETLLLRSCISERSFRTDVDDCLIVAEVVRERVERLGGTFAENLRALAPRLHGHPCRASRAWLCDLDVDCHRPRGLSATWDTPRGDEPSRREACEETVREVREILSGVRVSTCVERPRHWGSRDDVRRRERAGYRWRDAVCPGLVLLNRAGFLYRRVDAE